jgi:hypothetical protein
MSQIDIPRLQFKEIPTSDVWVFDLHEPDPKAELGSMLKAFKDSFLILYMPHHSSEFAFQMGKMAGKHSLDG